MKVTISMIPEEGRTVPISSSEPWVRDLVREALPVEQPDLTSVTGSVVISVLNENVTVEGEVALKIQVPCDRCLEPLVSKLDVPIRMDMVPLYRSKKEKDEARARKNEVELTEEDVEFSFYDGPDFNLQEIIREHIVLALPTQFLCSPACKGLCPRCGFNLNIGPCSCPTAPVDPRFAVLKDLKIKKLDS